MFKLGEFDYGDRSDELKNLVYRDEQRLDNGEVYKGQWISRTSIRHGRGMCISKDGSVYEGWWKNDKPDGRGRFLNSCDETVYVGDWVHNQMHGQGVYTWKDGSQYEGEFQHNKIQGFGKYTSMKGKIYEGQWVDNRKHGDGTVIWQDGRKYDGMFENDMKSVHGSYTWPDGRNYVGGWLQDKKHGIGCYTDKDGWVKMGLWIQGKRIRWLSLDQYGNQLTPRTLETIKTLTTSTDKSKVTNLKVPPFNLKDPQVAILAMQNEQTAHHTAQNESVDHMNQTSISASTMFDRMGSLNLRRGDSFADRGSETTFTPQLYKRNAALFSPQSMQQVTTFNSQTSNQTGRLLSPQSNMTPNQRDA